MRGECCNESYRELSGGAPVRPKEARAPHRPSPQSPPVEAPVEAPVDHVHATRAR